MYHNIKHNAIDTKHSTTYTLITAGTISQLKNKNNDMINMVYPHLTYKVNNTTTYKAKSLPG